MGVIRLREVDDYWSTDSILQHPWFSALMSRTRFRQIHRYFHVADNTLAKTGDKLDPLLIGSMLHFCRCIPHRSVYRSMSPCWELTVEFIFAVYAQKTKKFGIKFVGTL